MTALGWAFLPAEVFAVLAEAAFLAVSAVVAAGALWRVLRYRHARAAFRRGSIPDDGHPLSAGREAIWQRTLRDYRKRGHEPAFPELEDR